MKELTIRGLAGDSTLKVGGSLSDLEEYILPEKTVIITDSTVAHYYLKDFPPAEVVTIGTGENIKNLDTVRTLYDELMALEVDRSFSIVGVGGGIVCDITGFVASTYLRGLRFGFVPSTLLAQVDASVGGKNGVNLGGYKNMVGLFSQPEFVICDMNFLQTLPEKEVRCGLAEIVKHAVIADDGMFSYLERHHEKALGLDGDVIEQLVYDSLLIKSAIVERDEREGGERRKLNFGHTFGHALEKTTALSHGEAVSVGMAAASILSAKRGCLPAGDARRIKSLLEKLKLPAQPPFDAERVVDALGKDKKRKGDSIYFVLLHGIGEAVVEEIPIRELAEVIHRMSSQ